MPSASAVNVTPRFLSFAKSVRRSDAFATFARVPNAFHAFDLSKDPFQDGSFGAALSVEAVRVVGVDFVRAFPVGIYAFLEHALDVDSM